MYDKDWFEGWLDGSEDRCKDSWLDGFELGRQDSFGLMADCWAERIVMARAGNMAAKKVLRLTVVW